MQTVVEESTMLVDADSADEAEKIALELANKGEAIWRFLDTDGEINVVTIDAQGEPGRMIATQEK
jgi:hypothetical protein